MVTNFCFRCTPPWDRFTNNSTLITHGAAIGKLALNTRWYSRTVCFQMIQPVIGSEGANRSWHRSCYACALHEELFQILQPAQSYRRNGASNTRTVVDMKAFELFGIAKGRRNRSREFGFRHEDILDGRNTEQTRWNLSRKFRLGHLEDFKLVQVTKDVWQAAAPKVFTNVQFD
jgi:hypothetical protein